MIETYGEQIVGSDWSPHVAVLSNPFKLQWVPTPRPEPLPQGIPQQTQSVAGREDDFALLRKEYVIDDANAVQLFIRNYPPIVGILLEAVPHLKSCFGPHGTLHLVVLPDTVPPRTIYGVVTWNDSFESARAALKAFDESWWLDSSTRASGRIVFDYELA